MLHDLFKEYEALMAKADVAFSKVQGEHGSCVKCEIQCSDCCHSVFGLFLIEAAYLNSRFHKMLDVPRRQEALARGEQAGRDLAEMLERVRKYNASPEMQAQAMAKERIRCPLLDDEQKCVIYPFRPITCRAYGIPTVIGGKVHACYKAGFEKGQSYPSFNLDTVYQELYRLSSELLELAGQADKDKASLLLSVPKILSTPIEDLLGGEETGD